MPRHIPDAEFPTHFWSRSTRADCWEWQGATTSGYGCYRRLGRTYYAHQTAYELAVRPLVAGECVLHRCDNRLCVRPDHLFAGSQADNLRDAASKSRMLYGEANARAKLTADSVRQLRLLYSSGGHSQQALAAQFGVSQMAVCKIVNRVTWRRLAD